MNQFRALIADIDAVAKAFFTTPRVRKVVARHFEDFLLKAIANRTNESTWDIHWTQATDEDLIAARQTAIAFFKQSIGPAEFEGVWSNQRIVMAGKAAWLVSPCGNYKIRLVWAHKGYGATNWQIDLSDDAQKLLSRFTPDGTKRTHSRSEDGAVASVKTMVKKFFGVDLKPWQPRDLDPGVRAQQMREEHNRGERDIT